jgi:hypothetical protein
MNRSGPYKRNLSRSYLFLVETNVLEQSYVAIIHLGNNGRNLVTDAIGGHGHILSEELRQARGDGCKRELVLGTIFRAPEVRCKNNLSTGGSEVLNSRQRTSDTGLIGDGLAI